MRAAQIAASRIGIAHGTFGSTRQTAGPDVTGLPTSSGMLEVLLTAGSTRAPRFTVDTEARVADRGTAGRHSWPGPGPRASEPLSPLLDRRHADPRSTSMRRSAGGRGRA